MSVNGEKVKRLLYTYRTTKDMNAYNDLFVENEDLIKGTICKTIHSQNKTNKELIDEYLSVACIGFYKAVEAFDLSRIDDEKYFFSYAHVCIKNSLLEEIKKENRHSLNAVSIHETVKGTDDLTLEDTLEDKDDDIENFIDEESAFYKKKKILEVINKLSDKEKEIVMAYYGFNGRILTVRQIADMFNMSQYSISGIINSLNSYLAKELVEFREEYTLSKQANDSKSPYLPSPQRKYGVIKHGERVKDRRFLNGKEKMERYELLVEKYGESVVKEAIDLLPERNKRMIYLYYGMEGKIPKTQEELSRLFNLVNIDYAISSSMVRVESFLREKDIRVYETSNKGKKLYELIEKYGIEKVEEEIAKLDEIDKRLIEEYYAFGGKRKIDRSKSELSQKFNVSNVPSRVYNALNKIDKRLQVKSISKEEKTTKGQEEKMKKYNELVIQYGKDKVINAIKQLGERNGKIMFLYYGIGGDSPKTQIQLGEMFNLQKSAISGVIINSCDKILKILKGRNESENYSSSTEKKEQKIQRLISLYGKENVIKAIYKLSERDCEIMLLYFGFGGGRPQTQKELSERFDMKRSTLNMVVINSYNRIEKELERVFVVKNKKR